MPMARSAVLIAVLLALFPASAQAAGLTTTLNREMRRAGASSGAYVVDLDTGRQIYARRADVRRMPASVEKLYTTATAMLLYGTDGHLTTSVLATALPDEEGVVDGDLVLKGGGDPTFGTAQVNPLAEKLVRGGLTRVLGRVVGDESAFDPFRGVPSSHYLLTSDVGPLSALSFNHGRSGKRRPVLAAQPRRASWPTSSPARCASAASRSAPRPGPAGPRRGWTRCRSGTRPRSPRSPTRCSRRRTTTWPRC